MCNSANPITNVPPTDTSIWQKICEGTIITNVTKDSNGNLVFIFSNGTSFAVDMAVREVEIVDNDDIPALALTKENVTNVGKLAFTECDIDGNTNQFIVMYPGLYDVKVSNSGGGYLVSVERITEFKQLIGDNLYIAFKIVNPEIGLYGFGFRDSSNKAVTDIKIDSVKLIMRY